MTRLPRFALAVAFATTAASTSPVFANDLPTVERVEFVLECMRANPGPRHEMLYKCSCVLDELARTFPREQFIEGSTAANAMSIGGERGAVMRDSEGAKEIASGFRGALATARKSCFLN